VRQAYIERALRHHPDRQVGQDVAGHAESERRMQAVNSAWAVLGDREARAAYDAELGIVRVDERDDDGDGVDPVIDLRHPERTPLRRFVPLAVFLALALLFLVFTAYAGAPRS
jgi:curved DNA-binding protein CbpA